MNALIACEECCAVVTSAQKYGKLICAACAEKAAKGGAKNAG